MKPQTLICLVFSSIIGVVYSKVDDGPRPKPTTVPCSPPGMDCIHLCGGSTNRFDKGFLCHKHCSGDVNKPQCDENGFPLDLEAPYRLKTTDEVSVTTVTATVTETAFKTVASSTSSAS